MATNSGKISSDGRGPLSFGEREALKTQHANRDTASTYVEDQARHRRELATGMGTKFGGRATLSGPPHARDTLPASAKFPHTTVKFR
jgi:hypothetical protein